MAKKVTRKAPASDDAPLAPAEDAPPPRPPVTRLDQIVGQDAAKRVLAAAVASGRVHHAWIFHGPPGVGKFSTALAFAAALLDPTTRPDADGLPVPADDSEVQRMAVSGAHPDLHVITKELAAVSREDAVRRSKQMSLAKDVVEEFLVEPAQRSRVYTCDSAACKVFIVDEAELMNLATQNALLKTLEEPPAGTVIILVTSAEERLLTTIRSRAQRVGFVPLPEADMQAWLARRESRGGRPIDPSTAPWLLRFAAGSPGLAELAIEHGLDAWETALRPMLADAAAGRFPAGMAQKMAELIDERAAADVKRNPDASKDAANKAWARRMLGYVGEDLRTRLRAATKGKTAEAAEADPLCQRLLGAIDALGAAEGHLASNVQVPMLLENLAAQMCGDGAHV
jgi:DNA polymerase-3 subunit delta'